METSPISAAPSPSSQRSVHLEPLVQDELREVVAAHLGADRPATSLAPAALIEEAYLRTVGRGRIVWRDRPAFYAIAASHLRAMLVQHARVRSGPRLTLSVAPQGGAATRDLDLLALDAALDKLARIDGRKVAVVELRWFAGLTYEESARALGVASTTVRDDWVYCRGWLSRELETTT